MTPENAAQILIDLLQESGMTITFAESCTAGLAAATMAAVSGASGVFSGSFVTYSAATKESMVGVQPTTIEQFTVYSEEVAREMAEGCRAAVSADIGVGITGLAGPGGALPDKPIGTVCFGFSLPHTTMTETMHFEGMDRNGIRLAAVSHALARVVSLLTQ